MMKATVRQQASEIRAIPNDKSFEKLTKGLLAVSKADLDKLRAVEQEQKHGQKQD